MQCGVALLCLIRLRVQATLLGAAHGMLRGVQVGLVCAALTQRTSCSVVFVNGADEVNPVQTGRAPAVGGWGSVPVPAQLVG